MNAAYNNREDDIRNMVMDIVDTYHPAGRHGSEVKGAVYKNLILKMEENKKLSDSYYSRSFYL